MRIVRIWERIYLLGKPLLSANSRRVAKRGHGLIGFLEHSNEFMDLAAEDFNMNEGVLAENTSVSIFLM